MKPVLPIAADPRLYSWETIPRAIWRAPNANRVLVYRKIPTLLLSMRAVAAAAQGAIWLHFHDRTVADAAELGGRTPEWELFVPAGQEASDVVTDTPVPFKTGIVLVMSTTGASSTLTLAVLDIAARLNTAPWDPASGQSHCFGWRSGAER